MFKDQEIIIATPYYELVVDIPKNRIIIRVFGFWKSIENVPEYLNNWKVAISKVKKGFTILADLKQMKTHPKDMLELHIQAMDLTQASDCGPSASVVHYDIAELQMDRLYKQKQVEKNKYDSLVEAHAFLDQFT